MSEKHIADVSKMDTIYRQAALDAVNDCGICMQKILDLPSAQPEIKPIEYRDCVNAMLRMWIDNVVTDGEYNRIMDKLHAHWGMKNG